MSTEIDKVVADIFQRGVLRNEVHPEDARVIVTQHPLHFLAAARLKPYEAAILKIDSAQKEAMREKLKNIFRDVSGLARQLEVKFSGAHKQFSITRIDSMLEPIQEDLEILGKKFHTITGKVPRMFLMNDFKSEGGDRHKHPFDVMNVTFFNDGTCWKNPDGKILQVPEGDLFYFKKDFRHFSPEKSNPERMTIILQPKMGL